jgi:hypothetical protein
MPFMMMWTPYHYWKAFFAWQMNMADLMNFTGVNPRRETKNTRAEIQTSPGFSPADNLVADVGEIAAEAKERGTAQSPAKLAKPLPPRRPSSSKTLKRGQKNGSAKAAKLRRRRESSARA